MDGIKETLFKKAVKKYKKIFPCSRSRRFKDCFTVYEDTLYFWFNTKDQNTHVEFKKLA